MSYLVQATGRRKRAVARVRLHAGTGEVTINGKTGAEYFPQTAQRNAALAPLHVAEAAGQYDIHATIEGGGVSGQAGALRLGIARGLVA